MPPSVLTNSMVPSAAGEGHAHRGIEQLVDAIGDSDLDLLGRAPDDMTGAAPR